MTNNRSENSEILCRNLNDYGYSTKNLQLLGSGLEGSVYSTDSHIFKFFVEGTKTISEEKLAFIEKKFLNNSKISGTRPLSDIIRARDVLIFVTPYDMYSPFLGGDEESVLGILTDAKRNDYIYTNFHPKNLMYDSSHQLRIIDIGRSLEPYNEKGYQNMIRRAYLSVHYFQKNDLTELMSSLHRSENVRELIGIDKFLRKLYSNLESKNQEK